MSYLYNITKEPKGTIYVKLLSFMLKKCSEFSLVRQQKLSFNDSANKIKNKLSQFLIKSYISNKWPGTELSGGMAEVFIYKVTKESIDLLFCLDGLYSWLSPEYPEDLAFYDLDGNAFLITISHERDAYIETDSVGIEEELKKELPELELEKEG